MMIEGSGSVPLTNGSGSESRRPNNTAFSFLLFFYVTRRRADDGSGGSESDLSEEDEDTPTTTRSDHSLASSSEDDLSEDEEDLFFSDSSSSEEGEDVVVEEEEAKDLEAVLEAAQGTRVLPALWLSCIWLRAQPEVLAGIYSLLSFLCNGSWAVYQPVFRIRIHWFRIRIDDQKLEKIVGEKKIWYF